MYTQIKFITHYFGDPVTGGEKYNFTLINALIKNGYDVEIFTDDKLKKHVCKNPLFYNLYYISKIKKFKNSIVFVDSRQHPRLVFFVIILKLFTNAKFIGTVHHLTWSIRRNKAIQIIDKLVEKMFIGRYDKIIIPSQYTLQSVNELLNTGQKAHIIYPGINKIEKQPVSIKENNKRIHLLTVCVIERRKGLNFLVEAINKLHSDNLCLDIIGSFNKEPHYCEQLDQLIKKYNLTDKINLHGWVTRSELEEYYSKADCFVLPSLHEGYGIVIAEAMQYGLPIIASNITSIPELVTHNENGILVPPGNSDELAIAIKDLATSKTKREQMGKKNLEKARSFNTWPDVEQQFLSIIKQMVS